MGDDRKYVRVYYSIQDDPKFDRVRSDVAVLGTWLRLLMTADAQWPASADLPRWVRSSALSVLVDSGLVDILPEHRFRIHGLDAERSARRSAASNAAASRWHSERNAVGNAKPMPSKAEHSQADPRLDKDVERNNGARPWDKRASHLAAVEPNG